MSFKLYTDCVLCAHYEKGSKCKAFPERIPTLVKIGVVKHEKVIEGQVGDFVRIPITREEYRKKLGF